MAKAKSGAGKVPPALARNQFKPKAPAGKAGTAKADAKMAKGKTKAKGK